MMFWGAIGFDGPKLLVKSPQRMNSDGYVAILQIFAENVFGKKCLFQQDNAPIHKSGKTRRFFEYHNWTTLDWPPYSPDLNLIENLWAILKKNVHADPVFYENLEEKIRSAWNSISPVVIHKLFESMPKRIEEVIRKKGKPIKY